MEHCQFWIAFLIIICIATGSIRVRSPLFISSSTMFDRPATFNYSSYNRFIARPKTSRIIPVTPPKQPSDGQIGLRRHKQYLNMNSPIDQVNRNSRNLRRERSDLYDTMRIAPLHSLIPNRTESMTVKLLRNDVYTDHAKRKGTDRWHEFRRRPRSADPPLARSGPIAAAVVKSEDEQETLRRELQHRMKNMVSPKNESQIVEPSIANLSNLSIPLSPLSDTLESVKVPNGLSDGTVRTKALSKSKTKIRAKQLRIGSAVETGKMPGSIHRGRAVLERLGSPLQNETRSFSRFSATVQCRGITAFAVKNCGWIPAAISHLSPT